MLQPSFIRDNRDWVIQALTKKKVKQAETLIDELLQTDQTRKETQYKLDETLAEINQHSKLIGELMKSGKSEEANQKKEVVAQLKEKTKTQETQLKTLEQDLLQQLYALPNTACDRVPDGNGAQDNVIVKSYEPQKENPKIKTPHWDLIKTFDIIDFELGVKITGAGFPVYKGAGARLQRGLINFFLDEALKAGYTEIQPPILVNEASGYGTGQLPDKEGQMYHMPADGLYAIPTAEVPITNLYRDTIVEDKDLPIKNVGYTPCFRREAGSWGAHVRGLNRLHQFDKVEIVQIRKPEESYDTLEEMVAYVSMLLEKLELKYRVVKLCGGDMGFTSALTYDFEAFAEAQGIWLEVSSVSNFESFQANRLKLRYRTEDKKTALLHTLNGSALALPRIVAALLEANFHGDHIALPKVLQPYCGFDKITLP